MKEKDRDRDAWLAVDLLSMKGIVEEREQEKRGRVRKQGGLEMLKRNLREEEKYKIVSD
jgi:hypothetical protein